MQGRPSSWKDNSEGAGMAMTCANSLPQIVVGDTNGNIHYFNGQALHCLESLDC